jgi:hypothetical protein
MVRLATYLDESGTDERSDIVAVGGYVSTVELWQDFQNQWNEFLSSNNIKAFHATDLLALRKEFTEEKGWSKKRAESALRIADKIIEKHVLFGVVAYTNIADCETVLPLKPKNGSKRKKFSYEYFLSGSMVVNEVTAWANEIGCKEPVKFVFENGAQGKGYLMKALDFARKDNQARKAQKLVGSVSFDDKKCVPQLHAADRLIHLACKSINRFLKDENSVDKEIEKLIEAKLSRVVRLDKENLPVMIERYNERLAELDDL